MYWIKKLFSSATVHRRAFAEVFCVVVFSFVPLFVNYFVQGARGGEGKEAPAELLFGRGQIYLLAYALFGTIFWLAFLRGDRERHDARVILGAIATILMLPVVGFLGVDPTFSTVINEGLVTAGYWFYGGFALIYYLLLFYIEIEPPSPEEVLANETRDLIDNYRRLPES